MCDHGRPVTPASRAAEDALLLPFFPADGAPETLLRAVGSRPEVIDHAVARRAAQWALRAGGGAHLAAFAAATRRAADEAAARILSATRGTIVSRELRGARCTGCAHACGAQLQLPAYARADAHPLWPLRAELHALTVRVEILLELLGAGAASALDAFAEPRAAADLLDVCALVGASLPYLASRLVATLAALVALRPATLLALRRDALVTALDVHLGHAAALSFNSRCTVEDYFGLRMALDAAPLLLLLARDGAAAAWLRASAAAQRLSAALVSFVCQFAHGAGESYDAPPPADEYSELARAEHGGRRFSVAADVDAAFCAHPTSFTALVYLEIVCAWERDAGGFLELPAFVASGPPVVTRSCIEEYGERLCGAGRALHDAACAARGAAAAPPTAFRFADACVAAVLRSARPPADEPGPVAAALADAAVCARAGCHAPARVRCAGACRGLAGFCSDAHADAHGSCPMLPAAGGSEGWPRIVEELD